MLVSSPEVGAVPPAEGDWDLAPDLRLCEGPGCDDAEAGSGSVRYWHPISRVWHRPHTGLPRSHRVLAATHAWHAFCLGGWFFTPYRHRFTCLANEDATEIEGYQISDSRRHCLQGG